MGGILGRAPGSGRTGRGSHRTPADLAESRARVDPFASHARQWWEHLYGDDPLVLSLPGVCPATGASIRAYFGDGSGFDSAKKAANYVGITPSTWSSGTMNQPRGPSARRDRPASSGVLPGRQRCPDHGLAAGRVLSPAHDRIRTLPYTGQTSVAGKLAERTRKTLTTGQATF